jgi:ribosome-associated protein
MKPIEISTDYITLGVFLKMSDCISTGGQAKFFLQETKVLINNEPDNRRGRKLYPGDNLEVEGFGLFTIIGS